MPGHFQTASDFSNVKADFLDTSGVRIAFRGVKRLCQPPPFGYWSGDIEAGAKRIPVIVTIEAGGNGELSGSFETPSQVTTPVLKLSSVFASEESLSFDIPAIASRFEGEWSPETGTWIGVWKQSGMELRLELASGRPKALPKLPELDGIWKGSIELDGQTIPFIFRFTTSDVGTTGLFESPVFGLQNVPLKHISRAGQNLQFAVPATGASFNGALSADQMSADGVWSFPGQPDTPLQLQRIKDFIEAEHWPGDDAQDGATSDERSSILEQQVRFTGGGNGEFELAGTLTLPIGSGPFPTAILLTGSGPQDRDQTLYGHKPFAAIAGHLANKGIAVLRYDDRGFAESQGDFVSATSSDFADDAVAAMTFLKQQERVDTSAIGLIGHSEGAIVGNLAAIASPDASFLISLAGPGTDFTELQLAQRRAMARQAGFPEQAVLASEPMIREFYTAMLASPDQVTANEIASELLSPALLGALGANEAMKADLASHFSRDWFRFLLNHDVSSALAQLDIPVLALGGGLDLQVPSEANLAGIEQALTGNPDATIIRVENVNHMLQTATSGSPAEYEQIEEAVSPVVLDLFAEWINARL